MRSRRNVGTDGNGVDGNARFNCTVPRVARQNLPTVCDEHGAPKKELHRAAIVAVLDTAQDARERHWPVGHRAILAIAEKPAA